MIDTRVVKDSSGEIDLCETYSVDGFCLIQDNTNIIYGSSAIDTIEGYFDGKPYSRFNYSETEIKDEFYAEEEVIDE